MWICALFPLVLHRNELPTAINLAKWQSKNTIYLMHFLGKNFQLSVRAAENNLYEMFYLIIKLIVVL